jgi:DNA-directed RNA polymerase specialized sigma24 family protein
MAARAGHTVSSGDLQGLTALLERHYPRTYRIAVVLCAEVNLGRRVTRAVLRQGLRVHEKWQTESDVARWFAHHTVLLSRQALVHRLIDPATDPLLTITADPVFLTILRTIRILPPQQREAFLLHHGEQFDLRQMATAMDCSSEAAANHLVAGTHALRPVAVDRLGEFTAALPAMLQQLLPPHETIVMEAQRQSSRFVHRRRLARWVGWPLLTVALLAVAYCLWRLWQMLVI